MLLKRVVDDGSWLLFRFRQRPFGIFGTVLAAGVNQLARLECFLHVFKLVTVEETAGFNIVRVGAKLGQKVFDVHLFIAFRAIVLMSREYGVFVHFLEVLLRTVGDVGNWYSFFIGLLWTLLVKLIDKNGQFLSHVHGYEAVSSFIPYNFLVGRSLVMSLLVGI